MRPLEPGTNGVIAVIERPCGDRRAIAECARCERPKRIEARGLCAGCRVWCIRHGTIGQYGWTRADRIADYQALAGGLTAVEAAARLGVSVRTIERYKRELATAGRPA